MRSNYSGYVAIRRGLLEHLESGRMSATDLGFHETLTLRADPGTGIIWTNAARLAMQMNCSRTTVQKHLCRLERGGYIKRFPRQRSRLPYPILVNRYHCTLSPQRGLELNAEKTTDWKFPVYEGGRTPGRTPGRTEAGIDRMERARGELRTENKTQVNTRPPTPRAPSTPPVPGESEQRRRVEARDQRLQRENQVRVETQIGAGPELPTIRVSCLECRTTMNASQLNRCLKGKAPGGHGTYCPRNPAPHPNVAKAATG